MSVRAADTEAVIRNHLAAFLEGKGVEAILEDYDERARFYTDARVYRGKQEIRGFFEAFMRSLPEGAVERFSLRSLHVDGGIGHIVWSVGDDIPLGTDTFVVKNRLIAHQTFAMHAAKPR
jgi:hypothetical protein